MNRPYVMSDDDRVVFLTPKGKAARRCPICGRPTAPSRRPFCSRRCADVDLGRWLKDSYRIPTDEVPGEDEAGTAPESET